MESYLCRVCGKVRVRERVPWRICLYHEPALFYLPFGERFHCAAATEPIRREPGVPHGTVCRKYTPIHCKVTRAGVGVIYSVILPVGAELHDARACHLFIMTDVIGGLDVGAEDIVGL